MDTAMPAIGADRIDRRIAELEDLLKERDRRIEELKADFADAQAGRRAGRLRGRRAQHPGALARDLRHGRGVAGTTGMGPLCQEERRGDRQAHELVRLWNCGTSACPLSMIDGAASAAPEAWWSTR